MATVGIYIQKVLGDSFIHNMEFKPAENQLLLLMYFLELNRSLSNLWKPRRFLITFY